MIDQISISCDASASLLLECIIGSIKRGLKFVMTRNKRGFNRWIGADTVLLSTGWNFSALGKVTILSTHPWFLQWPSKDEFRE